MNLTNSEIEFLLDSSKLNQNSRTLLSIIYSSMNDWPSNIWSINEYLTEIERFINEPLTYETLTIKSCNLDYTQDAWKAESISGLLQVYSFLSKELPIRKIIEEMYNQLEI